MSKVFDRAMFKAENKPMKADSGIMQGFDDEGEIPEDEMMEEVSQRKPNSPEILMNNLRGDMRSVDARYQELADMVGDDVAMETPPEVLALLQAQLAQQSMGIGALPPGQGVPPQPMPAGQPPMPTTDMMGGMPPQMGGMPQPGAMPQGPESQMPQGFADGGMVMRGSLLGGGGGYAAQPNQFSGDFGNTTPSNIGFNDLMKSAGMPVPQIQQSSVGAGKLIGPPNLANSAGGFPDPRGQMPYNNVAPNTTNSSLGSVNGYGSGYGNQIGGMGGGGGSSGAFPLQGQYGIVKMAKGGIASLGNFSEGVAQAGRNGDTVLAHMTPEQHQYLTELGGGATVNPETGLPEHYMGMQALGNMGTAIANRAAPMLQQANVLAGRALYNPTFSAPVLNQARDASGRFGPMSFEGMNAYYPTFTQGIANSRVGQMVAQGADKLSKTPAAAKMGAAVMSIPGATYIADRFDNPNLSTANNNPPIIPGDPATDPAKRGMPVVEEDAAPESTPVNYNNLPAAPGAAAPAPASEADRNNQLIQAAIAKKTRGQRLEDYMAENVPIFEKYLGGDKDYNQAQALFVLSDMGLKLASTRKRGESFASTLARSAQGVPAGLSTIAAAEDQAKRQIKSAALTSGLQTIAAEDKQAADREKELIRSLKAKGDLVATDLGAGLTSYRSKDGQPAGMRVDETLTNSFLNSKFTPQAIKDDKGVVTGYDTPYARVGPQAQTINLDKGTRERLASEVSRYEQALSAMDDVVKEYTGAFGPKAFFSNLRNNVLVPVSPLDPNVMTEQQRTKINMTLNTAIKAIARAGDTGNIAVSEQAAASLILGDKPGTFFSDSEGALKRMMTARTSLANQRFNTASQLGWVNQEIVLDVPNLGTASDPIPQDKMSYLKSAAKNFPNGQVFIINAQGQVKPAPLSSITQ